MLRDYQIRIAQEGSEILHQEGLVYYAIQTRVGKTLISLETANLYGASNVLFVTKKKVIDDIYKQSKTIDIHYHLKVINYEQLHNEEAEYDLIIIDEAHSLGSFPTASLRATELKRIVNWNVVIFLSATPTPESYSQIYHQFYVSSFSPFKNYKNFYQWAREFVNIKQKFYFNRAVNDYSYAKENLIKPIINPYMITFTQEEAGFDSFVDESILYVKMDDSVYKLADYLKKNKIAKNKEGEIILGDTEVKLMNKLHQIYSGTVIVDEPEQLHKVLDYTKAEFIKQHFAGKKIAVFYNELTNVSVGVTDATGAAVTLDAKTLRFCVEDRYGVDVLTLNDGSITRSGSTFTVQIPQSLTDTVGANYRWSLRDLTSSLNTVLIHGQLIVAEAAEDEA